MLLRRFLGFIQLLIIRKHTSENWREKKKAWWMDLGDPYKYIICVFCDVNTIIDASCLQHAYMYCCGVKVQNTTCHCYSNLVSIMEINELLMQ